MAQRAVADGIEVEGIRGGGGLGLDDGAREGKAAMLVVDVARVVGEGAYPAVFLGSRGQASQGPADS